MNLFQGASANVRQRTTFHLTLSRLIFTTSDDMIPMFEAFMEPLLNVLMQLSGTPTFRQVTNGFRVVKSYPSPYGSNFLGYLPASSSTFPFTFSMYECFLLRHGLTS